MPYSTCFRDKGIPRDMLNPGSMRCTTMGGEKYGWSGLSALKEHLVLYCLSDSIK